MTVGIIYIARNDMRDSADHYKIGKSYKADPKIRMKELNEDTTLILVSLFSMEIFWFMMLMNANVLCTKSFKIKE